MTPYVPPPSAMNDGVLQEAYTLDSSTALGRFAFLAKKKVRVASGICATLALVASGVMIYFAGSKQAVVDEAQSKIDAEYNVVHTGNEYMKNVFNSFPTSVDYAHTLTKLTDAANLVTTSQNDYIKLYGPLDINITAPETDPERTDNGEPYKYTPEERKAEAERLTKLKQNTIARQLKNLCLSDIDAFKANEPWHVQLGFEGRTDISWKLASNSNNIWFDDNADGYINVAWELVDYKGELLAVVYAQYNEANAFNAFDLIVIGPSDEEIANIVLPENTIFESIANIVLPENTKVEEEKKKQEQLDKQKKAEEEKKKQDEAKAKEVAV